VLPSKVCRFELLLNKRLYSSLGVEALSFFGRVNSAEYSFTEWPGYGVQLHREISFALIAL
jgi:hypothetical protein